jgi:hypothetical protein
VETKREDIKSEPTFLLLNQQRSKSVKTLKKKIAKQRKAEINSEEPGPITYFYNMEAIANRSMYNNTK